MNFRNRPERDFATIRNAALRDTRISLKAKGLLALMLSFPDDWQYHQSHLETLSTDGRDGLRAAVRELEGAGYIIRQQVKDETGKFSKAVYLVTDDGKAVDGKPDDGKPAATNTDFTKTEKPEEEEDRARQKELIAEIGGGDDPLRHLMLRDRETYKSLQIMADELGWEYRHKKLAAEFFLADSGAAMKALRIAHKGARRRGADSYVYFETILTNPQPKKSKAASRRDEVLESDALAQYRELDL
jgi:hypothetical protein